MRDYDIKGYYVKRLEKGISLVLVFMSVFFFIIAATFIAFKGFTCLIIFCS